MGNAGPVVRFGHAISGLSTTTSSVLPSSVTDYGYAAL
ncbi:hypothetical protein WCP94_003599 [Bilophila wadsworthia]